MKEMQVISDDCKSVGWNAWIPEKEEADYNWCNLQSQEIIEFKRMFIDKHLLKISKSDVILIANFHKNGIAGYVGPNTLMEASFAYALKIPVLFLFNPSTQDCGLECLAISTGCLEGDLRTIPRFLN